jgi:hypothetical protein
MDLTQIYQLERDEIFWNIENIDEIDYGHQPYISLKGARHLSSTVKLKAFEASLSADIRFREDEKSLQVSLTISIEPKDELLMIFPFCKCWLTLLDGNLSKQLSCRMDVRKTYRGFSGSYDDFIFTKEDFTPCANFEKDCDVLISNFYFELEFVYKCTYPFERSYYAKIIEVGSYLKKLIFLDSLIQSLALNFSKGPLVKLISENKEFISIPLKFLMRFSPMMKCMLAGAEGETESEKMIEARTLEIQINPKFSIQHLKVFNSLVLGSREERIQFFGVGQDFEFVKQIYEFLDLYGFEDWKPVILSLMYQMMSGIYSHKLRENFCSWFSRFHPMIKSREI